MVRASLAPVLAAVLLAACNDGPGFDNIQGELFAETDRIKDFGAKPVGVPNVVYVELTADRADVTIANVNVLAVDSQPAFYPLDQWLAADTTRVLPEGIENADDVASGRPITVASGDAPYKWPFVFESQSEGWFQAQITWNHNGRGSNTVQDVRGHTAISDLSIYPYTADFGWVPAGGKGTAVIFIKNRGDLPLSITSNPASDRVSALEAEVVVVDPGDEYSYTLEYRALSDQPFASTISFQNGDQAVGEIDLRANNCLTGSPADYDRDGDDFTVCGGDCDDSRADVHPGAAEAPDTFDNDCDGTADNGTTGYDDDGDGYCDHPTACIGDVWLPGDCNDVDDAINPGADEANCPDDDNPLCSDGIDNDCDRVVDGGTEDVDGDGYTEDGGDCDPGNGAVAPNRPELPDAVDNDCDGIKDEGTVVYDDDGDGYCEGISPLPPGILPNTCSNPGGNARFGDCNDDPDLGGTLVYPGALEWTELSATTGYFGIDNDCDDVIDEGSPWGDDDGDHVTEAGGDCDDADASVGPAELEIPGNGVDDDCDPLTPLTGPQ